MIFISVLFRNRQARQKGFIMKKIIYKVTCPYGIHAGPAGILVKQIAGFHCDALIEKGQNKADAKRIMGLMSLGVKQGDTITITFDGEDEEVAASAIEIILKKSF